VIEPYAAVQLVLPSIQGFRCPVLLAILVWRWLAPGILLVLVVCTITAVAVAVAAVAIAIVAIVAAVDTLSKVGIPRLYQKVGNHPVEDEIVIKSVDAQLQKVADRMRTLLAP